MASTACLRSCEYFINYSCWPLLDSNSVEATDSLTEGAIKVTRIFNTYGPRMHHADGRAVSNFIVQALRGQPITIYGESEQTRSLSLSSERSSRFQASITIRREKWRW